MGWTRTEEKVLHRMGRAMGTFSMLRSGDRVAVAVSGGKDSLCLAHALVAYRKRAPFPFTIVAVTVEQGKFVGSTEGLQEVFKRIDVRWVLRKDTRTLALVDNGVEHGCDVCSRNRRSMLYAIASELDCTVLALGHTADDCAEALLRNILFNGRIASLPPVAQSRKGSVRIIRPLVFVSEELTRGYVQDRGLADIRCLCAEKEGPRSDIRSFLERMKRGYADVPESVAAALANVNPYTLFDSKLQKEDADPSPAFAGQEGR